MTSMAFISTVDVALSFTNTAASDVDLLISEFGSQYCFYDYRQFLLTQTGLNISAITKLIYDRRPTIVFASKDWFERPATVLEWKILTTSTHPKLVFDYSGKFVGLKQHKQIPSVKMGAFDQDKWPSLKSITEFLGEQFNQQF